jgi:tRNA modification GTPase
VLNKIDLCDAAPERSEERGRVTIRLSAREGQGVELLRTELLRVAGWHEHGEDVVLARERHLRALKTALAHVDEAQRCYHALELFAEELKLAQEAVSEITGEFTPDDLLGVIFSRFCIGK